MRFTILLIVGLIATQTFAQKSNPVKAADTKPKLVVGIVVDQMRWDYVNKFMIIFSSEWCIVLMTIQYKPWVSKITVQEK